MEESTLERVKEVGRTERERERKSPADRCGKEERKRERGMTW